MVLMIVLGHPSKIWKSQQPNFCGLLKLSYSRAVKEKTEQAVKSLGRKGIRELRGLFSSINYGSASLRRFGNGKDRALIIPQ